MILVYCLDQGPNPQPWCIRMALSRAGKISDRFSVCCGLEGLGAARLLGFLSRCVGGSSLRCGSELLCLVWGSNPLLLGEKVACHGWITGRLHLSLQCGLFLIFLVERSHLPRWWCFGRKPWSAVAVWCVWEGLCRILLHCPLDWSLWGCQPQRVLNSLSTESSEQF